MKKIFFNENEYLENNARYIYFLSVFEINYMPFSDIVSSLFISFMPSIKFN